MKIVVEIYPPILLMILSILFVRLGIYEIIPVCLFGVFCSMYTTFKK